MFRFSAAYGNPYLRSPPTLPQYSTFTPPDSSSPVLAPHQRISLQPLTEFSLRSPESTRTGDSGRGYGSESSRGFGMDSSSLGMDSNRGIENELSFENQRGNDNGRENRRGPENGRLFESGRLFENGRLGDQGRPMGSIMGIGSQQVRRHVSGDLYAAVSKPSLVSGDLYATVTKPNQFSPSVSASPARDSADSSPLPINQSNIFISVNKNDMGTHV